MAALLVLLRCKFYRRVIFMDGNDMLPLLPTLWSHICFIFC